ncbi:MAG: peptidase M16 [Rickettsiales bacterium]|nr:peptidase M16 [Rickettsiales bacterium]|tara:strand:- start:1164 stop:2474 length:1311 start_codon:yes stop_codon:yes gene_type:complete
MRLVLLIILSLFFSNSFSNEQTAPYSFKLKNGMKVVVIENKRAPVIAQMVWYNFGSGIEEKGKSGLAHFMEHLMFKGTRKFPDNYYSNYVSKIGGSENAFTSYDYTAYYQVFPKSELKKIMKMEADRMTNLTLTEENVEIEKRVILEERFQRIESDPSSKLDESMRSILFPNHYYGRPIIGWRHEIEGLTYDDVLSFYKKNYKPNNAVLVLSGDVDLEKAKKLSKKYFGKIRKGKKEPKLKVMDPDLNTNIFVTMKHSTVKQPVWKKFYRTISYKSDIDDSIALDMGLKIVASGTSSLLYQKLVEEKKTFSVVGGYYQGLTKGEGNVYLYAISNDKKKSEEIDRIIMKEFKNIINEKLTPKRFEIEKKKYFFDTIYKKDGVLNPAQIYGEALTVGLTMDEIKKWREKVNNISLDDVKKTLDQLYENQNYVIGELSN